MHRLGQLVSLNPPLGAAMPVKAAANLHRSTGAHEISCTPSLPGLPACPDRTGHSRRTQRPVPWELAVDGAADRLRGAEDLLNDTRQVARAAPGRHDARDADHIVHGDVASVLHVLGLRVPVRAQTRVVAGAVAVCATPQAVRLTAAAATAVPAENLRPHAHVTPRHYSCMQPRVARGPCAPSCGRAAAPSAP
eukprot:359303-Chlamydomonas_euryale.AAC.3